MVSFISKQCLDMQNSFRLKIGHAQLRSLSRHPLLNLAIPMTLLVFTANTDVTVVLLPAELPQGE